MLSLLATLTLAAQTKVDLPAAESVWVYSHAGDPTRDPYLRIWGAGGTATSGAGPSDDWSYGYLKFNLKDLPDGAPKSAELILFNIPKPSFKADSEPLQARALKGKFAAGEWTYANANDVVPGPDDTVFGEAGAKDLATDPVEIRIKFTKADFAAYLKKSGRELFLALTSKIDPNVEGGGSSKGGVYKVYSAAAEAKLRPVLHLEY